MTPEEFVAALAPLQVGIGKDLPANLQRVWYDRLLDLPAAAFAAAVDRWLIEVGGGFPSLADLRRFAVEFDAPPRLTTDEAWVAVERAARRYLALWSPHESDGKLRERAAGEAAGLIPDPLCREAVARLGGWAAFRRADLKDRGFAFRRVYEDCRAADARRRLIPAKARPKEIPPPPLTGADPPASAGLTPRLKDPRDIEEPRQYPPRPPRRRRPARRKAKPGGGMAPPEPNPVRRPPGGGPA